MAHLCLIVSPTNLLLLVVTAVLCWRCSSVTGQRLLGCPMSSLQIISYNETLLPRTTDNIRAQIQFTSGPLVATSFINYGPNHTDVWCAPELESLPEPRITLAFTETVVVMGIISGGYTYQTADLDGFREYVSSFTLEHTLRERSGEFSLYRANITGSGETEFVIDEDHVDQLVILKEPFSALRIRLQVMDRTRSDLVNITCWSIALLGCVASEAIYEEEDPVTDPTPTQITITETQVITRTSFADLTSETVTVTISSSSNCTPSVTTAAADQATQQAASVAIPIALVTVITVVIVVMLGVIVCIKRGRGKLTSDIRHSPDPHLSEPRDVHYINTGTGTGRIHIADANNDGSRERAVTIKEVENELYKLNDNRETDSAIYEAIPNSTALNTIQGNGNITVINSSPTPLAASVDPPPYSLLATVSPPLSAALLGDDQQVQTIDNQNCTKVQSDVYSEPFSPSKETLGSGQNRFQLFRNESYGSLPTPPPPHYATPTSTLQYIPEMQATTRPQADTDDYEPMMLLSDRKV